MADRYDIVIGTVTMTSLDTEYGVDIPKDACEVALRLSNAAIAWRTSVTAGVVAGGGGFPIPAGEPLLFDRPTAGQRILFASGSAAQTMNYSYLAPHRARP